jgi:hypothetical protein
MKMRDSFGLDRCDLKRLARCLARTHIQTVRIQPTIMHRKVPRCFRWNDSTEKLQIPSSKLPLSVADITLRKHAAVQLLRRTGQRSSKPQTSTRHPGWPPHRGLELKIWSFFGAWCWGLGDLVRAVFHRKQRRTHRKPSTRNPLCKRHVVGSSNRPSVVPSV